MLRIIFLILFVSLQATLKEQAFTKAHTIAKYISTIEPNLPKEVVEKYSLTIEFYSELYKVEEDIIVAIFKVESNFNMKAVNYKSRDFGIGQINAINMKYYKLDLGLQMTNYEYAIKSTITILRDIKKVYAKREPRFTKSLQWWSRYHSYKNKYRKIYDKKVRKQIILMKGE